MKNNKKIIALLLVLILAIYGYSKLIENNSGKQLSQTEIDKLSASLDKDIDVGKFEPLDTDNDGLFDKFVLTLDKEEVAEDLFLEKIVEYKKTTEGFIGTLTLEFENTGDETKTYSHTENIPKSFAAHVDDLEFSIPPTEIINPDPEVAWILEVMKRNIKRITIKAEATAMSAAMGADPGRALNIMLGMYDVSSKKMIEAGKDAATSVALDNLGIFVFTKALNDCSKFEGSLWNTCLVNLMIKSPDMFIESDCEKIDTDYSDAMNYVRGPMLQGMCKAIMTENWEECHENSKTWKEVDLCKLTLFRALSGDCEYSKDKDECVYKAAVKADSQYSCENITEPTMKYECLAEISQEIKHCKMISDKNTREYCCDKIVDDGAKKECYGDEEEEEEKKVEEEDDKIGEFNCPIPAGAIHRVGDEDWWSHSDSKYGMVGLSQIWYDKEKTKRHYVVCYNAEGLRHGVDMKWYENGNLAHEYYYKNDEREGTVREWSPHNGELILECDYKEGTCVSCTVGQWCN